MPCHSNYLKFGHILLIEMEEELNNNSTLQTDSFKQVKKNKLKHNMAFARAISRPKRINESSEMGPYCGCIIYRSKYKVRCALLKLSGLIYIYGRSLSSKFQPNRSSGTLQKVKLKFLPILHSKIVIFGHFQVSIEHSSRRRSDLRSISKCHQSILLQL